MTAEKLEKKTTVGMEPQKRYGQTPPSLWARVAVRRALPALCCTQHALCIGMEPQKRCGQTPPSLWRCGARCLRCTLPEASASA